MIQFVDTNSHTYWQKVQIRISFPWSDCPDAWHELIWAFAVCIQFNLLIAIQNCSSWHSKIYFFFHFTKYVISVLCRQFTWNANLKYLRNLKKKKIECQLLLLISPVRVAPLYDLAHFPHTLQPLYNTARYNTVLDITRLKDGSQKCIDYIEKWP